MIEPVIRLVKAGRISKAGQQVNIAVATTDGITARIRRYHATYRSDTAFDYGNDSNSPANRAQ